MKFVRLLLLVAAFGAVPALAQEQYSPEMRAQMIREIFAPTVMVEVGKDVSGGSGFIVSYSDEVAHIITNYHVVEDSLFEPAKKVRQKGKLVEQKRKARRRPLPLTVYAFEYASPWVDDVTVEDFPAELLAFNKETDVALLRIKKGSKAFFPQAVAALAPRDVKVARLSTSWTVGAPLRHDPLPTSGLFVGMERMPNPDSHVRMLISTAPATAGNSGGPTFHYAKERGRFEVVGVLTENSMDDKGMHVPHLTGVTPISHVHEFLDKKGFGFIVENQRQNR